MTDLDAVYTAEWYAADYGSIEVRRDWGLIASGLNRWAHCRDGIRNGLTYANDIGCGPGLLVDELNRRGWHIRGIDGSRNAIDAAVPGAATLIECRDLLDRPNIERLPIAICTEVAEHLPPENAPDLVRFVTDKAFRYVIFTAADVGQGGHHHLNEQPREYWLDLFAQQGWIEDVESTRELQARWAKVEHCWWIPRNLMVLH